MRAKQCEVASPRDYVDRCVAGGGYENISSPPRG
jgi:hypothetical protein